MYGRPMYWSGMLKACTRRLKGKSAQKAQATTLTPEYLQLQAISKWNGQLPQYLTPYTDRIFGGWKRKSSSAKTAGSWVAFSAT